ncbi:TonB-dependent receptor [Glaciecola sp. MH2013]|uniref:TonB-dependent receptor plug domain-containing protein n=1 Tax=Glaciecola sp. MH2013 TaxID=2785524 RepID=UPI00189DAD65|nr:TonB-dependent receptor [Glaciecola sp. MH2013]MBF7073885.1 TonB-dependent receptor [Glaciecola sp. MH2013]
MVFSPYARALQQVNDVDTHDAEQHEHEHEHEHEHKHTLESIIVRATRTGVALSDEPVRVQVIVGEEIQEKAMMRPGNISMLVAETGGVRVQTTSPALGSANIRLQGLYGRYTQLLSDGLPLYGGQSASIGLLQIPPTDLASVEIIKGSASSLYGGSAMGGVINLISRRPTGDNEAELLVNLTSRDGQDLTAYAATQIDKGIGASITAGLHHQASVDLDKDGWIDLAGYERVTARPRLFIETDNGSSVYFTAGVMQESRRGGTLAGTTVGSVGSPDFGGFVQHQDSERVDAGVIAEGSLYDSVNWHSRASLMLQKHNKEFGNIFEDDRHESYLIESNLSGYSDRTRWVAGIAFQSERFDSEQFSQFNYRFDTPGIFGELEHEFSDIISGSISARLDEHSEYGSQLSPRVSVLYRPSNFNIRASYGRGFFAPTPFVEAIEAAGLSRLDSLNDIREEKATTASVDIAYAHNSFESSVTLFSSSVDGVTELLPLSTQNNDTFDRVRLVNNPGESRIYGSELLLRYKYEALKLTASYLYLDATESIAPTGSNQGTRQRIALTPEHSAGFVAMWEEHGKFRLGFEAYYTGKQRLDNNPFRDESKSYWHLGLLGEITKGRVSYFINFENLLNIRQTKEDSLVLPNRAADGQWTTDIWSRNDGFVVNGGIRVNFGH